MKKVIAIGEKTFEASSSAFTLFAYKNETGRNLLDDLVEIENLFGDSVDASVISPFLENIFKLAYVMAKEADSKTPDFDSWLKQFDGILNDPEWIKEVVLLAASTFRWENN